MSRYRVDGQMFNFHGDSMNRSQLEQFEEDWIRMKRLLLAAGPATPAELAKRARRLAARGFLTIQTHQGLEVMGLTDKGRNAGRER